MERKTILITGANGQLGIELRQLLEPEAKFAVIPTDIAELDLTDPAAVKEAFERYAPAFVVNCSGYTAVDKAENEPEQARELNAVAVGRLARHCHETGALFVHISTDYVFDGRKEDPYTEEDRPDPQGVYGLTKREGEELALRYPCTVVLRTAWLYSPFGANFVKTMLRLGAEREEIGVVSDQYGSPTYARDLAEAIVRIVRRCAGESDPFRYHGIYHFSNEGSCSWHGFAEEIMRQRGLNCRVKPITTQEYGAVAARPAHSLLSKEKIKKTFGITPPQWQESLNDCLKRL